MAFADVAQQVFRGHLAIVQDDGARRRAANAQLVLFAADGEAGKVPFHQECGELFAADLGKHGEQVSEAGVGNPHLFAVQDVVLSIGCELRSGAAVQSIRSGRSFRQSVRADQFPRSQARQVFLFLFFCAEINQRKQSDAAVRAPGRGETGVLRDVVGDHGGGDFIHFEATVGFGDLDSAQTQFPGLLQQAAGNGEIFVLHLLHVRQDLVDGEFLRGLPNQLLLFGEVFGREDFVGTARFKQEAAAGDSGFGNCCGCGHVLISNPHRTKNRGVDAEKSTTHFNVCFVRNDRGEGSTGFNVFPGGLSMNFGYFGSNATQHM